VIKNPVVLITILLAIEGAVIWLANHDHYKKWFKVLPSLFWIYFLPMLASTVGLIDATSPIYSKIINSLLPASLFLLLITVDIKLILRLGRPALIMFFAGSAGVVFGAAIVFFTLKGWIGREFWAGFGAISASWTGGSANMIAVKEALGTPDSVFLPMVIVDTIVPYVWMAILVAFAGSQPMFDRWNGSDRRIFDQLNRRAHHQTGVQEQLTWVWWKVLLLVGAGIAVSMLVRALVKILPIGKEAWYAWTIILVTLLAIAFSFTPVKKVEKYGSTKIGYLILYFVLTAIGAKASLNNIGATVLLIVAGFTVVLIHAAVLVGTARLIRAPMFLAAVASQANIGGVASAPIVAEIYQPGFAPVGLLLAILGNIVGTYIGILTGQLCRLLM
jgi:uncharacterized membrane protein